MPGWIRKKGFPVKAEKNAAEIPHTCLLHYSLLTVFMAFKVLQRAISGIDILRSHSPKEVGMFFEPR